MYMFVNFDSIEAHICESSFPSYVKRKIEWFSNGITPNPIAILE